MSASPDQTVQRFQRLSFNSVKLFMHFFLQMPGANLQTDKKKTPVPTWNGNNPAVPPLLAVDRRPAQSSDSRRSDWLPANAGIAFQTTSCAPGCHAHVPPDSSGGNFDHFPPGWVPVSAPSLPGGSARRPLLPGGPGLAYFPPSSLLRVSIVPYYL